MNSLAEGRPVVTLDSVAETHFDDWTARNYETLWPVLFDPAGGGTGRRPGALPWPFLGFGHGHRVWVELDGLDR